MEKSETATEVTYVVATPHGDTTFIVHKDPPLRWTVIPPAAEVQDKTWVDVVANIDLSLPPLT